MDLRDLLEDAKLLPELGRLEYALESRQTVAFRKHRLEQYACQLSPWVEACVPFLVTLFHERERHVTYVTWGGCQIRPIEIYFYKAGFGFRCEVYEEGHPYHKPSYIEYLCIQNKIIHNRIIHGRISKLEQTWPSLAAYLSLCAKIRLLRAV